MNKVKSLARIRLPSITRVLHIGNIVAIYKSQPRFLASSTLATIICIHNTRAHVPFVEFIKVCNSIRIIRDISACLINTQVGAYGYDVPGSLWWEDIRDWIYFRLANLCNYTIPATSIIEIRTDDLVVKVSLLLVLKENWGHGRLMPEVRSGR